jgi:hypothetical protein
MGMGMKPLVKEKGWGVPFLEGVARIVFVNFQKISKGDCWIPCLPSPSPIQQFIGEDGIRKYIIIYILSFLLTNNMIDNPI